MTLLIDAYNVLHCTHVLPERYATLTAPQLGVLLDRTAFFRGGRGRVVIVCDGRPKPNEDTYADLGSVELLYSGPNTDADTVIERLVERDAAPRELVVVSNDRQVQRAARRGGGRWQRSETFLRRLAAAVDSYEAERAGGSTADAEEKPQGPADAEAWMRRFGLSDEGPAPPSELESDTDRWLREFGFKPER